jgi:hypothetical protein
MDPRLYGNRGYAHRRFCSKACSDVGWNVQQQRRQYNYQLKRPFIELAGGKCMRCGYAEFQSGLDFHHIDGRLKEYAPQTIIKSADYDRVYAELDKCALLCRNCHSSFHAGEWFASFVKRDGLGWDIDPTTLAKP